MNRLLPTWMATLTLAVAGTGAPRSDAQAPGKAVLQDAPLPAGATARFGGGRLRHGDAVRCVAFSPDGKLLVSGSAIMDGTIRLWHVADGREMRRTASGQGSVASVAFSPDGKLIASGGGRGAALRLWDVATGSMVRQMQLSPQWTSVYSVAFSPDGKVLATGNLNSTISFWNPENARQIGQLETPGDAGTALCCASDGKTLLSWGTLSKTVRLWDLAADKQSYVVGCTDVSCPAVFAPDGNTFATGSADGTIRIWSTAMGTELAALHGHTDGITAVAFSSDGERLISSSLDRTARVWDLASGKQIRLVKVHGRAPSMALSPDGHTVAVHFKERSGIRLWNADTGDWLSGDEPEDIPWTRVAISPDGKLLAVVRRRQVEIWNMPTRTLAHVFDIDIGAREVVFSADGKRVCVRLVRGLSLTQFETTVRSWDAVTGEDKLCYRGAEHGGALAPDGETLAVWRRKQPVLLRNLVTQETRELPAGPPAVRSGATFSPDGRYLAVASPGGYVRVWDATAGRDVASISTGIQRVRAMAFSPDGALLACTAVSQKNNEPAGITLFDVAGGQPIRTLEGHHGEVQLVAFSPNGHILASGGRDQTVRFWSLLTGDEVRRYQDLGNTPMSMAFAPDGTSLITGMSGGGAFVWEVPAKKPPTPQRR